MDNKVLPCIGGTTLKLLLMENKDRNLRYSEKIRIEGRVWVGLYLSSLTN